MVDWLSRWLRPSRLPSRLLCRPAAEPLEDRVLLSGDAGPGNQRYGPPP